MKSIKGKIAMFFSITVSLAIILVSVLGYIRAYENAINVSEIQSKEKLKGDINGLKKYIEFEYGDLSYKGGQLQDNKGNSISKKYEVLDEVKNDFSDVATIFVKDNSDFTRIATNVLDETGSRMDGTNLDTTMESYKSLINGNSYTGRTTINKIEYFTTYEPIIKNGETIGALFVGVPMDDINKEISGTMSKHLIMVVSMDIFFIILSIIISLILAKTITKSLNETVRFAKKIQDLDVSEDINLKLLNTKDEVGQVIGSIQTAIVNLREFAKVTSEESDNIDNFSMVLENNINQVSDTSKEISNVVVQIADGATNQAKSTEEGKDKVEDLGDFIENCKIELTNLNNLMKEVENLKQDGIKSMEDLTKESVVSTDSTRNIYNVIIETNKKAKRIEEASLKIREIGEQTDLLALNAAIEAVRAGDSGNGFNVVAEEIRKLAEESNKFTGEISSIIDDLIQSTEQAVSTMKNMMALMDNQNKNVQLTSEKFVGISGSIEKSMLSLESLNSISESMEKEKEVIIQVMEGLSSIAEENAASTEEVAASVQEQEASIQEFKDLILNMSELSAEMKENIKKFKY